jgi:hypothetical protein
VEPEYLPHMHKYRQERSTRIIVEFTDSRVREHIRWKPTTPCKLWKLQSEPHDVDPTKDLWKMGGVGFYLILPHRL